jgi:hypothetical protein
MPSHYPKFICCYKVEDQITAMILRAPNKDIAELYVQLHSMEENSSLIPATILDVSECNPNHHISLEIH